MIFDVSTNTFTPLRDEQIAALTSPQRVAYDGMVMAVNALKAADAEVEATQQRVTDDMAALADAEAKRPRAPTPTELAKHMIAENRARYT